MGCVGLSALSLSDDVAPRTVTECVFDKMENKLPPKSEAHCWKDGKMYGQWEIRYADGQVDIGFVVDGKRHGQWENRLADGRVNTGFVVDGKEHGQWKFRHTDGSVDTGSMVNGKPQGQWELRMQAAVCSLEPWWTASCTGSGKSGLPTAVWSDGYTLTASVNNPPSLPTRATLRRGFY